MAGRIVTWSAILFSSAALAACEDPVLATDQIRAVLTGAPPAAELDPAAPEEAVPEPVETPVLVLPTGDTLHLSDPVAGFYRARAYVPAWTGYHALTPEGQRVLAAIGSVEFDGLDPDQYHHAVARRLAAVLEADEAGDRKLELLAALDLLLTESFVRLAVDLERGVLDPASLGQRWQIERAESDPARVASWLTAGEDPNAILATVRPRHPYYRRLAEAHRRLDAVAETGGWAAVPDGETLRTGDRDERVAAVRARLQAGDDPEENRLAATGRSDPAYFDESLEAAVERFQLRHTLHEDGAVGPETIAAMNVPVEERLATVRLNLDRWRWLPRELGEMFILVNVAGFELEVVSNDTALESMSVVVGRTANRTPVFEDTLEYMVVNPYWNVPVSIARAEILPAAWRDPGYLARNNYEVLSNGHVVSVSQVTEADLESGRYRIRQRPGPSNALGDVKFLFPNDMNIYLHDTPAGHLFDQRSRAFSYGCIRVERPRDLARVLLEHLTDRDPGEYDRLRARSGEQWLTFDRQIPIYIVYFTAWAHDDGALRFHPDIYEMDEGLAVD